ncbi:hypothetical protein ABW19_dt0202103 [Dactylella cylindrospora]|nr:hypothetical protein ABW19_dt0202103 [Dactylella cylindrospora]
MLRSILLSAAFLGILQGVTAHGSIKKPRPILFDEKRGTYNAPLAPDFSNFPCKGFHNQPFSAAETWTAGQEASFVVDTSHIAAHGGGSCQASISHDGGKTFEVLHSFIGDCPRGANGNSIGPEQEFKFKIPESEPAGPAIFAWTWFAAIANREMYMNCAYVTIKNDNPNAGAVSSRPQMFVGFLSGGACSISEGSNLDFPEPGQFVTDGTQNPTAQFNGKTKPSGSDCGNAASGGGESIKNILPPNAELANSGSNPGGSNPKPGPPTTIAPSAAISAQPTTMPTTMVTSVASQPAQDSRVVVTVTEIVTNAVTDVVYVTSTAYQTAILIMQPTGTPAKVKRSGPISQPENIHLQIVPRDEDDSCSFETALKVGDVCPVPSVKASQWKDCVWKQFCKCLDENLSTSDIVNFVQVKGHCDCLEMGVGCPTGGSKLRHRKRHAHFGGIDILLPRSEARLERFFKA